MSRTFRNLALFLAVALGCGGRAFAAPTPIGSITITGGERSSGGVWDNGTVSATINGISISIAYGQFSNPASIASGLAATISQTCNMPVYAQATGATINFYTKGSTALSSATVSSTSTNPSLFPGSAFLLAAASSCAAGVVDYYADDGNEGTDVEQMVCLYYDSESGIDASVETDNDSYSDFQDPGTLWVFGIGEEGQLYAGTSYVSLWDSGMQFDSPSDNGGNIISIDSGNMTSTYLTYFLNGLYEECTQQPLEFDPSGCSWNGPYGGMSVELDLRAAPTVNLTTSNTSSVAGEPVTLTATIAPSDVTGTMQFYANGWGPLGTGTISQGTATLTTNILPAGTDSIVATLTGNADYFTAQSSAITVVVTKATPILNVSCPNHYYTWVEMCALSLSGAAFANTPVSGFYYSVDGGPSNFSYADNSVDVGVLTPGTYSVQVEWPGDEYYDAPASGSGRFTVPKAPVTMDLSCANEVCGLWLPQSYGYDDSIAGATGLLAFTINGKQYTSVSVSGGGFVSVPGPPNGGGLWGDGTYLITASYSGDSNFYPASSTQTVQVSTNPIVSPPVSVSCSPNPIASGSQSIACTANVGNVLQEPTGTISVSVNGSTLGTSTLTGGRASVAGVENLTQGSYTVVANYNGDPSGYYFASSGSAPLTVLTQEVPSVSIACSPNPLPAGSQTTTCTATVNDGATGTVTLTIQGGTWTSPTTWVTLPISNGSVSATGFNGAPAGLYEVVASYSGDSNNAAGSASATVSIQNAGPGSSTYYNYTVAGGGYDSNGNVLAYTDSVMGSWNFWYDQLNRLVAAANTSEPAGSAWGPYFCWAYDNFGNRLAQSTSNAAFTWGSGNCTFNGTEYQNTLASYNTQNQMVSTNAPGFPWPPLYDGAGDLTDDGNNAYLYDAEGRICAVTSDGYSTAYLYDAAGNRVAKGTISSWSCDMTTNGFQQTTGYVVGPSGEQLTEVGANNTIWNHTNVYASGKQIGTYDKAGLHLYIDDPLGTRRAQISDSSGTLEATYQSLPFGDGLNSIPYATGVTDPTENHFTGKERDTESGNDYMFARYYNSATGRFLSPDWSAKVEPVPYAKLGNPQSLNLYSYVLNNPVGSFDPDGHACKSDLCQKFANFVTHNGWKTDKEAFPAPTPRQWPAQGPPSMQGVNPATGQTLFSRDPKGVTGNERPGVGGSGNFGACRGSGCSRTHEGEDISAPVGSPVHASTSGVVTFSGTMSGYGNTIKISNGAGVTTLYGHDSSNAVAVGDHVTQGQVIGVSGQTGNAEGQPASEAHIHFEVSVGGTRVDPAIWLDSAVNSK